MLKKSANYRGQLLYGDKLAHFHTLGVGQKLGYIREILEEEYGDEFSRSRVAKKCGLTHQGQYHLEEKSKKKPRERTLNKLLEIYNIPHSLLKDNNDNPKSRFRIDPAPIYIGKPEDRALYLKDVVEQQASMEDSLRNYTPSADDLLEVDFEMIAYIPDTPLIHKRGRYARRVRLTSEDIQMLEGLIETQIEIIASRREALEKLRQEDDYWGYTRS
ncbi:hypothetical protein [Paenibacillus harenae]|uniref:hypothetical protein n=1 Tax=Paenibacillus harenae TaxID=306543 RepID=UPI0027934AC0|nr:hypothetical protein [Paenibacillus harenae]MDQ0059448.1 transcriptional regulator with XRE-family HTH domain [Paenibacillus harenae]